MSSTTVEADKLPSLTSAQPCHHFSLVEIQSATNDFDDQLVIGEGGFGKVYKGRLCVEETSHVVAIKRLDSMSDQGAPEFRAEIEMLSKLHHCHLVSLIGFCDDNKEMILVYAYMPHGTLYHHLYKAFTYLNWVHRLKIAIGAARGLDYLHTGVGTQHGVIHRDIKSSNILLDENWWAMISDFGLSKVGPTNQSVSYVDTGVKGTFGYLDPEYFYTRRLTRKTDVFAFGVVLFELLSGRRPVDISFGEEQCSLVRWAQKCVKDRKLDQMVDSNIRGTISPKCLTRFAQIAYRCVHTVPKERPSMTEVVASLQLLIELQEKHDDSAESSSKMGFSWKIHKYLVPTSKQNSEQSGTSSQKSLSTKKDGSDDGEMPLQLGGLVRVARDLKKFTYFELKCATRNFGTCLVQTNTFEVFKGWVDKTTYSPSDDINGLAITIKKFYRYKHLDLDVLKELNHPNLVKLIGCCLRFQEIFLVYEFMPLGSLEDCLYTDTIASLSLVTKVKIVVGIARGMVFLQKKKTLVKSFGKTHLGRTVGDSWIDRHKTFLDEDLTDDDDDPWFSKESSRPRSYDIWDKTIDEYELDRCNILLDEDFTPKLSSYITHSNYVYCYEEGTLEYGDYYPGKWPRLLQNDFSGFAVVLAEVLIGRELSAVRGFERIEDLLRQHGKTSLLSIAKFCFEVCNEADSELRMLTILKDYIPTIWTLYFKMYNNNIRSTVDSTSSIEMNSVSDKIPASPLRVPPSPGRFSRSPKLDRIGSVHLTLSQVARATQNFSSSLRLAEGGFGTVYKAQLQDGQVVAIKRAKKEHFDALRSEFKSGVELLAKIDHRNLVKLLGYVDNGNERLIITEYVPNGTLREHLDGVHGSFLDFSQRLEISIDIAHGLVYLHLYAEKQIIHRDVKSSNILLTERKRAKVADFRFAKLADGESDKTHVMTKVRGTVGYLDPEYMRTYQLTPKSDVYSFGVLLIEILTGRRPIESRRSHEEKVTIRWAFGKFNDGEVMDLVDPQLKEGVDPDVFAKMLVLAFQCAAPTPADRPDMKAVGEQLWAIRMDYLRHGGKGEFN